MKRLTLKLLAFLFIVFSMSGCSLLKFSIDTGDLPLTAEAMRIRMLTRGYYYEMTSNIAQAADTIIAQSSHPDAQIRAIQWKINATKAAVSASMQSAPEIALVDTWILAKRMDQAFSMSPDSLLFYEHSDIARRTAAHILLKIDTVAHMSLDKKKYPLIVEFVDMYMANNPITSAEIEPVNTMLLFVEYMRNHGEEYMTPIGTISEGTANVSDQVSGQIDAITRSLGWGVDLVQLKFEQDGMRDKLAMQLDTLEADLRRMVVVVEHLPEISNYLMKELSARVNDIVYELNHTVDNTFDKVNFQRLALQDFVDEQRDSLIVQAQRAVDAAVAETMSLVPGLIGKVLLYIVLFFLVMLSVPFVLGFLLGKARRGKKKDNDPTHNV